MRKEWDNKGKKRWKKRRCCGNEMRCRFFLFSRNMKPSNQSSDIHCMTNSMPWKQVCLRIKSLSMPYSFRVSLLNGNPATQGWREEYYRSRTERKHQIRKQKILRWRFFSPSAGLDLAGLKGCRCIFTRKEDGIRVFREPKRQRYGLTSLVI